MKKNYFITIEGCEGAGKSTNLSFIADYLAAQGIDYVLTREPGGTPLAENIRELLLSTQQQEVFDHHTELLLMYAARAQHIAHKIKPALAKGQWVVCDRFYDASFAYQGGGRGINLEKINQLNSWLLDGFKPDLTLLFDIPVEQGLARAKKRSAADRFEKETVDFFNRVREMYLTLAQQEPERFVVINAGNDLASVQQQVKQALESVCS